MKQVGGKFDSGCSLEEAETTCEIIGLCFKPISNEFEATVVERAKDGSEISRLVAASPSLTRLVKIIEPAAPTNL